MLTEFEQTAARQSQLSRHNRAASFKCTTISDTKGYRVETVEHHREPNQGWITERQWCFNPEGRLVKVGVQRWNHGQVSSFMLERLDHGAWAIIGDGFIANLSKQEPKVLV